MRFILCVALLFCTVCHAADNLSGLLKQAVDKQSLTDKAHEVQNNDNINKLYKASKDYISHSEIDQIKWKKNWEEQVKTAEGDNPSFTEETYTMDHIKNFCRDLGLTKDNPDLKKIKEKKDIVKLVMLYIRIIDKKFVLPNNDWFTPENTKKIIDFLVEQQIAATPLPENKP